jgi:CO/xanthine dehydrogenase Mo-binding subunit
MLYAKVLRSPYPHARIVNIDTSKAERLTEIKAVITGKDAPQERVGFIRDRCLLARDVVRFVGEAVAAVAADTIEAAEEALA